MKLSNKLWIHWGKNPNDVFQYLKISKAGAKLDESKKFIQWFRFVKDYRDKKGARWFLDYEIYRSLLKVAPEAKIATALQSLKDIKDLKNLAEIVQNYQFKLWVGRKDPRTDGNGERLEQLQVLSYDVHWTFTQGRDIPVSTLYSFNT
ncbi:hypothetical protein PC116_g15418 [Phytophthora cactorum]|uniref:RXLR phytopathogen effector protein WY-domain domain-containing protein n=1 Tax=Phytophthora cactorum TaxID=29920 RepID=A0A8T1BW64_9STRA|nr:hypothetical protein PC115_g12976 [Phytophthora cactorum]KAG2928061.1 hypothetical protein PC117_g14425 [Phytophthora cactorum]KAG4236510.1 hypothetical protein PC116_g15418 [Phytophthora cactorum]